MTQEFLGNWLTLGGERAHEQAVLVVDDGSLRGVCLSEVDSCNQAGFEHTV